MQEIPLIEMQNITKTFGGVTANEKVSFKVFAGKIHALLGENGAGKSTLMSIMAGLYRPDSGQLKIKGQPVYFASPKDALIAKIGMIYQHVRLVENFTVSENIVLGAESHKLRLNYKAMAAETRILSEKTGLQVDPYAKVGDLSLGEQQRVEILKMLYRGCEVLIMDEPTTVLTPQEVDDLFVILKQLTNQGMAIVLITHKMQEVMAVADEVTVLRHGRVVGSDLMERLDQEQLTNMLLSAGATSELPASALADFDKSETVLELRNLGVKATEGYWVLRDINLQVCSGEIVVIAGVAGNGQNELIESIAGLQSADEGQILLHGQDISSLAVRRRIDLGVALVPEQRLGVGLASGLDTYDNSILHNYFTPKFSGRFFLKAKKIAAHADHLVAQYRIDVSDLKNPVTYMSGGNLQKLLLGREIGQQPQLLLAAHPIRGLDVGAAQYLYNIFREAKAGGMAILLVIEDLENVFEIADRVAVMYAGHLQAVLDVRNTNIREVGALMLGAEKRNGYV